MSVINTQVKGLNRKQIKDKAEKVTNAANKLKGAKRLKALKIAASLRYMAKDSPSRKKTKNAVKSLTSDPKQGILPGFTNMMKNPQVAELARDLLFQALSQSLTSEVEKLSNVLHLKKKA